MNYQTIGSEEKARALQAELDAILSWEYEFSNVGNPDRIQEPPRDATTSSLRNHDGIGTTRSKANTPSPEGGFSDLIFS